MLSALLQDLKEGVVSRNVVLPREVEVRLDVCQVQRALVDLVEIAQPPHPLDDLLELVALRQLESERRSCSEKGLDPLESLLRIGVAKELVRFSNELEGSTQNSFQLGLDVRDTSLSAPRPADS